MDNVKNEEERIILLTDDQAKQTLTDFYRSVAQSAGHEEEEDTRYDCTKILVSANVQDAIIKAYEEEQPGVAKESIIVLLAMAGPKADMELGINEVKIQPGFISLSQTDEEGDHNEKSV